MTGSTARAIAAAAALTMAAGHAAAQTEGQLIGLSDAVRTAEQAIDGRAFEAEVESANGRTQYELKLVDLENRVHEIEIEAETGQIVSREEQRFEGLRRRWLNTEELEAVTRAERTLADIIASLEAETGARVHEAEVDTEDDRVIYEIELAGPDGEEIEAEVDVRTGEVRERVRD